jgi:hypothetical protein
LAVTIRKRRQPTPHFKLPPPYQPITGERAGLLVRGQYPYCAMMQVAADDEHDDYVICRGYDPRIRRFIEYDSEDEDKPGIPVAKPYGNRIAGQYTVGHVFPAVLPLTKFGQNSGVAATSQGQPADLDEELEILYTDDSKPINWLLLDNPVLRRFELKDALAPGGNATAYLWESDGPNTDIEFEVYDALGTCRGRAKDAYGSPHNQGSRGYAAFMPETEHWEVISVQPHALTIRGQATGDVATTDSTFTIDGTAVMQPTGGLITDQDPAGNITIYNVFSWEGDEDGEVQADWNEGTDRWEASQFECPA